MAYIPPLNGGRINATIAGNTAGAGALVSTGTLTLAGGNNITLSQAGNAITISGAAGGGGNVNFSAGTTSNNLGSVVFSNSNGMSFGLNGSTITGAQGLSFSAGSQSTLTASGTMNATAFNLNGVGGASVGFSNSSAFVSAPPVTNLTASGAINLSSNGSTITISSPVMSMGMMTTTAGGGTGGTSGTVSNGLQFAAGSNITLSQSTNSNGATVSIYGTSGGGGGGGTLSMYALGNTTQSSSASLDQRSVSLNGLGAMTVGYSNGSVQLSAPATSSLVGTGGISISTNGSTISVSGPTLSTWEPWPVLSAGTGVLSGNTGTAGAATFVPFVVPVNVSAGYVNVIQSMNLTTGGTSVFSQSATMNYGLYTQGTGTNSTTISQVTSNSWSYQMSYNNSTMTVSYPTSSATSGFGYGSTTSAGINLSSQFTGLKLVRLPISTALTPGTYWLGLFDRASTAGFNSGVLHSYAGNAQIFTGLSPMGGLSSGYTSGTNVVGGVGNWMQGFGSHSSGAGQTNLLGTVALSAISQNVSIIPFMKFVIS
jgi:hypothetical protein